MKTLDSHDLDTVAGGVASSKSSTEITNALTAVQSSLKDLASQNNNNSSNNLLPLIMIMALNRPQPTVVAAAAPAPVAFGGGPIINISNRYRRGW
jgi:hypothetical protein